MVLQIDRLDKRMATVDGKMLQIQGATERYIRAKDNISNVLAEIEKINEYFKVAKQVEPIVKAGWNSKQQEVFFSAVTKLHTAQRFFVSRKKDIKASGQALKAVDALIKTAVSNCMDELERLLKLYGKTVELVDGAQFRVITADTEVSTVLRDIRGICETLSESGHTEHLEAYQRIRTAQAIEELQAHESSTMSAWEGLLQDVPYQKGTHPLKSYAALAHETIRGELQLWRSTLLRNTYTESAPSSSASASSSNNNSGSSSSRSTRSLNKDTVAVYASIADAIVMEMQRVLSPLLFDDDVDDTAVTVTAGVTDTPATGKKKRGVLRLKEVIKFKFLKHQKSVLNSVPDMVNRQSNSFLIRLDMLDIFMAHYQDMRDLCLSALIDAEGSKQVRFQKPSKVVIGDGDASAAEALVTMRDAIVEACVESITQLLSITQDQAGKSGKTGLGAASGTGAGASAGAGAGAGAGGAGAGGAADDDQLTCDLQPITGNVLYCCKELMHFNLVYQHLHDLAREIDIDLPADTPTLTDLVATLLDNLFKTLQKKSEKLDPVGGKGAVALSVRLLNLKGHALFDAGEKDATEYLLRSRKHLFLSNNLYSLHTYLQEKKKELTAYAAAASSSSAGTGTVGSKGTLPGGSGGADSLRQMLRLSENVERKLSDELRRFCDTVAAASSMTTEELNTFTAEFKATTDKQARSKLLKAKFSLFNSAMDALLMQQGEWRVSSAGLREHLGIMLVAKICPLYGQFYGTYSTIPFSKKHMEDYLRFPPSDVERALRFFFGKS